MATYVYEGDVLAFEIIGSLTVSKMIFLGARVHTDVLHYCEEHNIFIFDRFDGTTYETLTERKAKEAPGWKPTMTYSAIVKDVPQLTDIEMARFDLVKQLLGESHVGPIGWFHHAGFC